MNEPQKLITLFLEFIRQNEALIKLSNSSFQIEDYQVRLTEKYSEYLSGKKKEFHKEFGHIFFINGILVDQDILSKNLVTGKLELFKRWLTNQFSEFIDVNEINKLTYFFKFNWKNSFEINNFSIIEVFVFFLSYKRMVNFDSSEDQNSHKKALQKFIEKEYFYPFINNIAKFQIKKSNREGTKDTENIKDNTVNDILPPLINSFRKILNEMSIFDNLNNFNKYYWYKSVYHEICKLFPQKLKKPPLEFSYDVPIGNEDEQTFLEFIPADKKYESEEVFDRNNSSQVFTKTIFEVFVENGNDNTKKLMFIFLSSFITEYKMVAESLGSVEATITNLSNAIKTDFVYLLNMTVEEYLKDILNKPEKEKILRNFYDSEMEETFDTEEFVSQLNHKVKVENAKGIIRILQALKIRNYIKALCKEFGIETKTFRNEIIMKIQDSNSNFWNNSLIIEKELTDVINKMGIKISPQRIKEISTNVKFFGRDITRVIYDDTNIINIDDGSEFYKDFKKYIINKIFPSKNIIFENIINNKTEFSENEGKIKNRIIFNFFMSFKYDKESKFKLSSETEFYPFRVFETLDVKKESKYLSAIADFLQDQNYLVINDFNLKLT